MPTSRLCAQVPAVKAGQVWQPELPSWYAYSWQNFAVLLDGLADHVAAAKAAVGCSEWSSLGSLFWPVEVSLLTLSSQRGQGFGFAETLT